jgi:hypothetical protein
VKHCNLNAEKEGNSLMHYTDNNNRGKKNIPIAVDRLDNNNLHASMKETSAGAQLLMRWIEERGSTECRNVTS